MRRRAGHVQAGRGRTHYAAAWCVQSEPPSPLITASHAFCVFVLVRACSERQRATDCALDGGARGAARACFTGAARPIAHSGPMRACDCDCESESECE